MYWYTLTKPSGEREILTEYMTIDSLYQIGTSQAYNAAVSFDSDILDIIDIAVNSGIYEYNRSEYKKNEIIILNGIQFDVIHCHFSKGSGNDISYTLVNRDGVCQIWEEQSINNNILKKKTTGITINLPKGYSVDPRVVNIPDVINASGCSKNNPKCVVVQSSACGNDFLYCREHKLEVFDEGEIL